MADSLEKIAKDISRLGCDFPTEGTYDEQVKSSGFTRLLMYNCMLFDCLYSCAKNGACGTCKAYATICAAEARGGEIAREVAYWRELLAQDQDFSAPRRGEPEVLKPPRQKTGPSPAILEGTR